MQILMIMKQNMSLDNIKYSQKTNGHKKSLGGYCVFSKNLMGPIRWNVGCPRLHLFMEKKVQQVQTLGKGDL